MRMAFIFSRPNEFIVAEPSPEKGSAVKGALAARNARTLDSAAPLRYHRTAMNDWTAENQPFQ